MFKAGDKVLVKQSGFAVSPTGTLVWHDTARQLQGLIVSVHGKQVGVRTSPEGYFDVYGIDQLEALPDN